MGSTQYAVYGWMRYAKKPSILKEFNALFRFTIKSQEN